MCVCVFYVSYISAGGNAWQELWDAQYNCMYWYNTATGELALAVLHFPLPGLIVRRPRCLLTRIGDGSIAALHQCSKHVCFCICTAQTCECALLRTVYMLHPLCHVCVALAGTSQWERPDEMDAAVKALPVDNEDTPQDVDRFVCCAAA